MKKVLKSGLLHSIDMFWLAAHFRGPTAPYIGMSCFLFTLWRKCAHFGTISKIFQNKSLQKYRKVKHLKALLLARSEVRITPAWLHWDLILRPVGHQAHGQLCELLSVNGVSKVWMGVLLQRTIPKLMSNDLTCQISNSNGRMLVYKQLRQIRD